MCGIKRIRQKTAAIVDILPLRELRSTEDGFAVAMVLFIVMIISLLGISMLTVAAYQMRDSDRTLPSNRAFDLADSGLSYAHGYLAQDNTIPDPPSKYDSGSLQMGSANSTFDVTVQKDTDGSGAVIPYQYRLISTGSYQQNEGTSGGPSYRTYTRKLEEKVKYRGAAGHFDCFNYTMFSKSGDVSLDTGWLMANGTGYTVDGNVYAGNDVSLHDTKAFIAAGSLVINGNVVAGRDADLQARSGIGALANDQVYGNLTAGRNVSISSQSGCVASSTYLVSGSINAAGDVSLSSSVFALASASVKVAQNANTNINAGDDVTLNSHATVFAVSATLVGSSSVPANVNANGDVNINANDDALTPGSISRVYGNVSARGQANLTATTGFLCGPQARVDGYMKNNGHSSLSATGFGSQQAVVGGLWQHGGGCSRNGNTSYGSHSDTNPNVGSAPVSTVPDVEMPEPDWNWYRTMAVAQGHYYTGNQNFTNVNIDGDPSSMWVMYVANGDVSIQNILYNVNKKGVIVCEGDVSVTHSVQLAAGTEYQVICRGNITHSSYMTLNPNANDTIFLYTDGTHDHDGNPATLSGNVTYDLGWFRDIKGQITAKGNISAPVSGIIRDAHITYQAPSVPVAAWPIPFDVLSFREL